MLSSSQSATETDNQLCDSTVGQPNLWRKRIQEGIWGGLGLGLISIWKSRQFFLRTGWARVARVFGLARASTRYWKSDDTTVREQNLERARENWIINQNDIGYWSLTRQTRTQTPRRLVGAAQGKSDSFLAQKRQKNNKDVGFYIVDWYDLRCFSNTQIW